MASIDWKVIRLLCVGPYGLRNSHTYGLEKYNHPEFQCVLNLNDGLIMYTLNSLGVRVAAGERFHEGQLITDLFEGDVNARLDKAIESGRTVLRVILPDPQLRWPEDPICDEPYIHQTIKVFEDDSDYPCNMQQCQNPCEMKKH